LPSALHPVAWFGSVAQLLIRPAPRRGPVLAGAIGLLLALGLPLAAAFLAEQALLWSARFHPAALFALQVLLVYACVCLYGLMDAGRQLGAALRESGLPAARERLRWLCSRDPSQLDETDLLNGAIASLAENLADSVVAPLFFLGCFGLPGAVAYRAINTLDAMVGYRGEYEWLGKAAARIDDVANWLPARLTVLLLMAAAAFSGELSIPRGVRIWQRDRALTPSPNGGHPMAVAAGLLGVQLDKPSVYVLGPELPRPAPRDLERALWLCGRGGELALISAALVLVARGVCGV
jgi:adenosylcobinamide-phosphate synthase